MSFAVAAFAFRGSAAFARSIMVSQAAARDAGPTGRGTVRLDDEQRSRIIIDSYRHSGDRYVHRAGRRCPPLIAYQNESKSFDGGTGDIPITAAGLNLIL